VDEETVRLHQCRVHEKSEKRAKKGDSALYNNFLSITGINSHKGRCPLFPRQKFDMKIHRENL